MESKNLASEKVRLSRWQDRPSADDYIKALFTDFIELHGDKLSYDDKSIISVTEPEVVSDFTMSDSQTVERILNLYYANSEYKPQGTNKLHLTRGIK